MVGELPRWAYECTRPVSYWERVYASEGHARMELGELEDHEVEDFPVLHYSWEGSTDE